MSTGVIVFICGAFLFLFIIVLVFLSDIAFQLSRISDKLELIAINIEGYETDEKLTERED